VKDEYNAIFINGEAVGETMFYGPGAGSLPTATAVMSDVVTVIKNMQSEANSRDIYTPTQSIPIAQPEESFSKYYIRLHRSEERRVGKECRCWLRCDTCKEKKIDKRGKGII